MALAVLLGSATPYSIIYAGGVQSGGLKKSPARQGRAGLAQ
jgi:hypothetical protein